MSEPRTLGERYALGEVLGSGGAAQVHRATDTLLGVDRAVKLLLDSGPHAELLRSRLRNEARIMAQLRHPNVLRVYDIGVQEGQDYIVMDLAEGGSLSQWLDSEGPMHPAVAVHYTLQVLSALDAAHQAGVVHRDVKPQNVLLDSHGGAMLADFGIALLSEDALRTTRTNMAMGSMCFMAPEQRMDAKNVGPEADLYAVACSLYNLLTDGNPIDLFTAKIGSGRWDGVPGALKPILWRATRHDPEERYPDAAAMAADLARALPELGDLPTPQKPDAPLQPGQSLPLPTPEATASAISRIAEGRTRRVTAASPVSPSTNVEAAETFLSMDLASEEVEADSLLGDRAPEEGGGPTLVPDLGAAVAQLTAAVPYAPTQMPPEPEVPAPTQTPSASMLAPQAAQAPPQSKGVWVAVALALLLLLALALPQLIGDRSSVSPTASSSSAPPPALDGGAVLEPGGSGAEPVDDASEATEAAPPAEAPVATAPRVQTPATAEGGASTAAEPASGSKRATGSGDPPATTPRPAQPAAEVAASTSAVAGTWILTAAVVAPNTLLRLGGSDDALRGQLLFASGVDGEQFTGRYEPATGLLVLKTRGGSIYLEANYPGEGRSMQGKVYGQQGDSPATLARK